jgi:GT2 family glycosyltransferase
MAARSTNRVGSSRERATKKARKTPLVTVVVSFRERWRFTAQTVESILRNTSGDFALWVLDSGMPDDVRAGLRPDVHGGNVRIVPIAEGRQPNEWRASIIPLVSSPYAVFIDNDVVVRPGWLDRMVACAEETGAGIVCPLYLWGEGPDSDVIHMAGGELTLQATPGGTKMTERHRHVDKTIWEVPEDLHRQTCGFGEFHCLMMRREIYSAEGMFDPSIITVHEHIHASMLARELGYETWFEPDSRVAYLAFAPWRVGELDALRTRWDCTEANDSLAAFARRWNVIDDDEYRFGMRYFLSTHAGHTDVLDPRPTTGARRDRIMTSADLQMTAAGLQRLALDSGYDVFDVGKLVHAYKQAAWLTDGLYRPCGRPFINHLAGTASVLLFYGCALPQVIAGLLHAALTHGPKGTADALLTNFGRRNTVTDGAVKLVRLYGARADVLDSLDLGGAALAELPVETAALLLIDAANEVDMYLSWEVNATGRTDVMPERRLASCDALLPYLGLPGLAATLRQVRQDTALLPVAFERGLKASIRFTNAAPRPQPQKIAPNKPAVTPAPQH